MSEHLDSYLMSVGMALSQEKVDLDGATKILSAPEILDHVDGSNIQQLIRVSLLSMQMDPGSAMIAEVGVLLSMIKPELEIDFGLKVGVANAQSCALFAMYSIALHQGNVLAALALLQNMIPSLKASNDRKGLLEVMCWLGVLHENAEDYASASDAFTAAIEALNDRDTAEALLDNSALDMVREDNQNVFSFPRLEFFQFNQSTDVAKALIDRLKVVKAKLRS